MIANHNPSHLEPHINPGKGTRSVAPSNIYESSSKMTYFPDLSPYDYLSERNRSYADHKEPMINVGWLDSAHAFESGKMSQEFVDLLTRVAEPLRNMFRGFHDCPFCCEPSPIRLTVPATGGVLWLGNGEIHVRGLEGELYSAPSLVIHYVQKHEYRPPAGFVNAVESACAVD